MNVSQFRTFILSYRLSILAMLFLLCLSFYSLTSLYAVSSFIADIFIRFLKFISLPIIFLSIASTISSMSNIDETKTLGRNVIKYTLITTIIASSLSLLLYVIINPTNQQKLILTNDHTSASNEVYIQHLINIIPTDWVNPFLEHNVVSVALMAFLVSVSSLFLPDEKRCFLNNVFSSLFETMMLLTQGLLKLLPIAIVAFVSLFIRDLGKDENLNNLWLYLVTLLSANVLQVFVVLPLFLIMNKICPLKTMSGVFPALNIAFFSKSSCAALPTAIRCSESNLKLSPTITRFTFPLCTTINMNACASFILITVLFVSNSNGVFFSPIELFVWIFIATIAAIGNAGVPMGCFLLSTILLTSLDVPLQLMGAILPFYAILDMVESASNLWSDTCVAAVVDKKYKEAKLLDKEVTQSDEQLQH